MRELWGEITASISRNKLRSALTGFSVAWGIYLLAVLLGTSNGIQNGALARMTDRVMNVVQVWRGWTSKPYAGYAVDRRIDIRRDDARFVEQTFPFTEGVSGRISKSGAITSGEYVLTVRLRGVSELQEKIAGITISRGRFLNGGDMAERRRVIVLDRAASEILFPRQEALGKWVAFDSVSYRVIGLSEPRFAGQSSYDCYAPLTTLETTYSGTAADYEGLQFMVNGLDSREKNEAFNTALRTGFAARHSFDRTDESAIWIYNRYENYISENQVIGFINVFLWVIAIMTLLAGIVGVSNIMLVTVRERMNEIGIRKSLGATPWSVIRMVLFESLVITTAAGYIGLVFGMLSMEGFSYVIENVLGPDSQIFIIFRNPTVDLGVAVSATVVLIVAGLVAGYVPARQAVKMKTIDALRYNK